MGSATAIDTLDTVTTALSGLIDASSGYATLVTGASGSKVIHVLQQGGITGITSSTSLAAPATDAAAYAETVEVGGTVVARETWNITLTPSSGSPVTFSYVAGSGADTADAQTVAQRLAAAVDVDVAALFAQRKVAGAVDGESEHPWVRSKDRRCGITLVHVEIDHH